MVYSWLMQIIRGHLLYPLTIRSIILWTLEHLRFLTLLMNKLAVDTYYSSGKAYTVGVVFSSWSQKYPDQIISTESEIEEDYIPGEFYKRELPCIMNLISGAINLQYFDTIIVDGFVMLPGDKKGLGAKLWDLVKDKFPHLMKFMQGVHHTHYFKVL